MRFIDIEGKTPVNTPADMDFPGWVPWTQGAWDSWLSTSTTYLAELEKLNAADDTKGRNDFIDAHSAHWGQLKIWLKVLSKGKCWFSEVRELYSHYDVEHFRPKKIAKNSDGTDRDGYWWLAFDYTNYRLCGNVGNRKKGGWFPLRDGSICSTNDNPREESEEGYLLDPTDAEDVNLISFDPTGNAIPSPNISAWEKIRVDETIKRLKLNQHNELAEARRKIWQKINFEINQYQKFKARCTKSGNPAAKAKVLEHCRNIKKLTAYDAELSSVAKWSVLYRNDQQLSRLIA